MVSLKKEYRTIYCKLNFRADQDCTIDVHSMLRLLSL